MGTDVGWVHRRRRYLSALPMGVQTNRYTIDALAYSRRQDQDQTKTVRRDEPDGSMAWFGGTPGAVVVKAGCSRYFTVPVPRSMDHATLGQGDDNGQAR